MGNQQSRSKRRVTNRFQHYSPNPSLGSSPPYKTRHIVDPDSYCKTSHLQLDYGQRTEDHKAEIGAIHDSSFELEKKVDEMTRKHAKVREDGIHWVIRKNTILESEVSNLKEKVAALELRPLVTCTQDHKDDIGAIRKTNLELERKFDELTRKVDELQSQPFTASNTISEETLESSEKLLGAGCNIAIALICVLIVMFLLFQS